MTIYCCKKCSKQLEEVGETIYLHEKINNLKPGDFYCEKCIKKAKRIEYIKKLFSF